MFDAQAQLTATIQEAFEGLRDEDNGAGKYVRPDLHDPDFLQRIQPLVLARAKANPSRPWREHFERVYIAEGGRIIPKLTATTTKLNQRNGAAKRASSYNSGSVGVEEIDLDPRPGETAEETTRRAYAALMGGR